MHIRVWSAGRLRTLLTIFAISATMLAAYLGRSMSSLHSNVVSHNLLASMVPRPANMSEAADPQLRRLFQYEHVLQYRFTSEMLFIATPRTASEGQAEAETLAVTLKEYQKYNLVPLIIIEPTDNGALIDLRQLHTAPYTAALESLCSNLKRAGITDAQMGTVVPLPEADLPDWGGASTDPSLFAQNYMVVSNVFEQSFPQIHFSMLLDSTVYPSGDTKHLDGDVSASALLRYVNAIKQTPGMPTIDSLGFQGFPWTVGDSASDYLNEATAQALARTLGTRTIWFNTGTARSYGGTAVPDAVRKKQLFGELAQAQVLQGSGFTVRMNIFGFIDTDTDWTYPLSTGSQATRSLAAFMQDAHMQGIETSLFASGR